MATPPGSEPTATPDDPVDGALDDGLEKLLVYLKEARGSDFTGYKRASLRRRVRRRMDQVGCEDYLDYLDFLQVNPDEFAALLTTILINVTGFFRDPETWQQLGAEVLPALLRARRPDAQLRVWCAGCASGQEAYTVAIVLAEILGVETFRDRVKIYATDVDEDALADARAAVYDERDLRGVPAELHQSYFEPIGSRWAFRKDLRRSVIFGRNDLVRDAPISRVDLLTCRNTLMYFTPETQAGVLNRLRFALAPDGVLVLGKAEMLLAHSRAFDPVDLRRRIFHKTGSSVQGGLSFAPEVALDGRAPLGGIDRLRDHAFTAGPLPQVVLTEDDVVALINQQAEELLGVSARDIGRPLRDLEISYRPVELRSVVERARIERRTQRLTDVTVERGDDVLYFEVHVMPLATADRALVGVSVVFHDVTVAHRLYLDLERTNQQLESAYAELQSTSEELETTNEELQSTVEELETTNEELQSTNEELETMNEELLSTNDELQRINDGVRERSGDLDRVTEFLDSILTSLRSAVVVIDPQMRIMVWNSGAEDLWGLRGDEVHGEHLLNLDIGFPLQQLQPDVRAVLSTGERREGEPVEAVNRRGRQVTVRVSVAPLVSGATITGAVLIMA